MAEMMAIVKSTQINFVVKLFKEQNIKKVGNLFFYEMFFVFQNWGGCDGQRVTNMYMDGFHVNGPERECIM